MKTFESIKVTKSKNHVTSSPERVECFDTQTAESIKK